MVEVLIFDLDGTLVDSEPLPYQAFNEVFSQVSSRQHWWCDHSKRSASSKDNNSPPANNRGEYP